MLNIIIPFNIVRTPQYTLWGNIIILVLLTMFMSGKKISVFLTGLLVLSVLLTAPAQANSTDETEARSSPPPSDFDVT